jgi:hypothetical protein
VTTGVKLIKPGDLCIQCGRCCHFANGTPCPFLRDDNLCSIYRIRKVIIWCGDPVELLARGLDALPHDCPVYLKIMEGTP